MNMDFWIYDSGKVYYLLHRNAVYNVFFFKDSLNVNTECMNFTENASFTSKLQYLIFLVIFFILMN